jgi:hypothetical protein
MAVVGLKLLGVWILFLAVQYLGILLSAFVIPSITNPPHVGDRMGDLWQTSGTFLIIFITNLVFGLFVLFRADWIAKKLRFPDSVPSTKITPTQVLQIGLVLLGIYFMLQSTPVLIRWIWNVVINDYSGTSVWYGLGEKFIPSLVTFLLAGALARWPAKIASLIFPPSANPAA